MLANEFNYFLRQPLVWLSASLYLAFAGLVSFGVADPDLIPVKQYHYKAMTLLMLGLPLLIGALAPISFLRDHTSNMAELIGVTPQTSLTHLKFRALALVGFSLFIAAVGTMLCAALIAQQTNSSVLALIYAANWDLIVLYLPSVIAYTCFAAWLCHRFQSAAGVYAVFSSLWGSYMVLASMSGISIMAGSYIANETLLGVMLWLDPYGISNIFSQFRTGLVSGELNMELGVNRVLYLAAGGLFFLLAAKQASKPLNQSGQNGTLLSNFKPEWLTAKADKPFSLPKLLDPVSTLYLTSVKSLLANKLTQLIFVAWFFLIFSEVAAGISHVEPMAQLPPTSLEAWNRVAFDLIPVLGNLLLLFWTWQICWRPKQVNMSELIAATAVSSRQQVMANLYSAFTALAALLFVSMLAVFASENWAGSTLLPWHYSKMPVLLALPLLLSACLYVAINTLIKNRIGAAFASLLCILFKFTPLMARWGLDHPLWNIAGVPLLKPDLLWRFEASLSTFVPYMMFWLVIATACLIIATTFSHRGTSLPSATWASLGKKSKLITAFSLASVIVVVGVMHQLLLAERPLMNKTAQHEWRAEYETQYGQWQNKAQPQITHMHVLGDLYPEEGNAYFTLELTLTNETSEPIEQVLVGGIHGFEFDALVMPEAESVEKNLELNQHLFTLKQPLQPQQSVLLNASISYQQPKLWPAALHQIVTSGFTYFRSNPVMPNIGFNPDFRLRDNTRRLEMGLPALPDIKPTTHISNEQLASHPYSSAAQGQYKRMQVHSIITTTARHEVVAPGKLLSSTVKGNRATYEFKTGQPIRDIAAWFSLPYSSMTDYADNTELHVYAPELSTARYKEAAAINLQGMKDTLTWFNANVSSYQGARLNLIAIPDLGATGYAMPHNMLIGHSVGFRALPTFDAETSKSLDQRYRRAVHETAHQWFGHDVGNGVDWDSTFLIESMAKYIELVILEQHRGQKELDALIHYEYLRFLYASSSDTTKPVALIDATSAHDMYSRATLVFTILRAEIGDKPIVSSLKTLWREHKYPKAPASSVDFIRLLKQATTPEHHQLIDRLFLSDDIEFLLEHELFKEEIGK